MLYINIMYICMYVYMYNIDIDIDNGERNAVYSSILA